MSYNYNTYYSNENDLNYQPSNYHNYIHVNNNTRNSTPQQEYNAPQQNYNPEAYNDIPHQNNPEGYNNNRRRQYIPSNPYRTSIDFQNEIQQNNPSDQNENYPYIRHDNYDEENDLSNSVINTYLRNDDSFEFENSDDDDLDNQSLATADKLKIKSQIHNLSSYTLSSNASSVETMVSQRDVTHHSYNTLSNAPIRRDTVTRKFQLQNGNFVFDSPISPSLLIRYNDAAAKRQYALTNEFKFMRYQAITCEPNELLQENFSVRQLQYMVPRETELLITVTMYNEDHILLARTLRGVMKNIKHMIKRTNSSVWGPEAWKKIVVCVVSDGRSKINEKALSLLSSLGCYQDGFAKKTINNKNVNTHVYEHTTLMNITDINEQTGMINIECDENTVPIQLLFCLKEKNQKKINSHRWVFEGFSELLQPHIITLLDCGTMPGNESIYNLWKEFKNPQVGGACGEIKTDIGKYGKNLLNPLVASQNFEYKMSNILDKTTESNFGFISVLPGAFSAYRFEALRGEPLTKYFLGEYMEADQSAFHFFSSNMYLAEDRILCFEIVMKKNANWILKYCKNSFATTDVPTSVSEFIMQRRRWLNGSFFASIYSLSHFGRIWTSGHSLFRKFFLQIEFIYILINTVLSWFALSSFFLVFRILCLSVALSYSTVFNVLSVVFFWLYGICVASTFILSLGNKPKSSRLFYMVTIIFFAVVMLYMIAISCFLTVKSVEVFIASEQEHDYSTLSEKIEEFFVDDNFRNLVISIGSTYALYIISSLLYMQPMHMLTSFAQYVLLSPSYINVLNIYAFCNLHDISWGTKSSGDEKENNNVADLVNGVIKSGSNGEFELEVLIKPTEIQENYDKRLSNLYAVAEKDDGTTSEAPVTLSYEERKLGYNSSVRSLLIILWLISNFVVVTIVLESGGIIDYILTQGYKDSSSDVNVAHVVLPTQTKYYFNVLLWLVAFNAVIRFFGCVYYLVCLPLKKLNYEKRERALV
ncbi:hypothetical protein TPHA_0O01680 [Tetrapisispora phaffii CBS 4417]|uniref:Chitin synthase n=1 Tax=Tetrapisispora phaffii (strain ATCC 24235 / CBS 4417 / NBRC 1672 / NRRL Y-8282 / UCD 70-5) TaxID=1071381 RepID=G8C1V7_TETPH|nr:hypothetical protein TPHA_0O01680 [Tetrapisispora phaffii CBS 4417]CCE66135.1 hypothetical protein TPHA_0O01680 [Tetrapisispora phaffii CBS 4417]